MEIQELWKFDIPDYFHLAQSSLQPSDKGWFALFLRALRPVLKLSFFREKKSLKASFIYWNKLGPKYRLQVLKLKIAYYNMVSSKINYISVYNFNEYGGKLPNFEKKQQTTSAIRIRDNNWKMLFKSRLARSERTYSRLYPYYAEVILIFTLNSR